MNHYYLGSLGACDGNIGCQLSARTTCDYDCSDYGQTIQKRQKKMSQDVICSIGVADYCVGIIMGYSLYSRCWVVWVPGSRRSLCPVVQEPTQASQWLGYYTLVWVVLSQLNYCNQTKVNIDCCQNKLTFLLPISPSICVYSGRGKRKDGGTAALLNPVAWQPICWSNLLLLFHLNCCCMRIVVSSRLAVIYGHHHSMY